ncbi:MAG TPA: OmpA family protein [Burkholderiaceae bacterium]|nr:OmpA family protein [Burkholderiaceae bacterium]
MDLAVLPLAALLAFIIAQNNATTGQERVVLLPDADGKTGAVVVKTAREERLLNTPYATILIDKRGAITNQDDAQAALRERYAASLQALPPRPRSFVVHFESGSATDFVAGSRPVLEELKAFLAAHPAPEITVIGHTDRVGTVEFNDALSRQRAQTLRDLLVEVGIQATSMDVAGRGEREPLVSTADEVPEEKNRRVEISVR